MSPINVVFPNEDGPSRAKKWRIKKGEFVNVGKLLLIYTDVATDKVEKRMKSTQVGKVVKLCVKENDVLHPGQVIAQLEKCKHPTVMKGMCAECGADLIEEAESGQKEALMQANVPMVHSIPELKVTPELAEKIGLEDKERLLNDKRLVLLVDLDQTIIHTTNDHVPNDLEDVFHFQLYGKFSPWYHTRLRPHTRQFLKRISELYELHICTFGVRQYAHHIARTLDQTGELFSHRILSRDECFDPQSKTANLRALFPCGVDMVCIIDDRDDVWQGCLNLVQVKPYHYFKNTGDINAPDGLAKRDPQAPKIDTEEDLFKENDEGNMESNNGDSNSEEKPLNNENKEEFSNSDNDQEVEEINESSEKCETVKEEKENEEDKVDKEDKTEKEDVKTDKNNEKEAENDESKKKENENKDKVKKDNEDHDDYLLYLEDILKRIHAEFYNEKNGDPRTKTLKEIIPKVRLGILKGLHLTFSGLVPTNQNLDESRPYKVAKGIGATITQELTDKTTHLVAVHPGTAKCREAKKNPKIKIVNPDWLWTCAERWEHVDERLFPLKEAREFRKPPPHCTTPDPSTLLEAEDEEDPNHFPDNPLITLSRDEIADMGKEVDDDLKDSSDESDNDNDTSNSCKKRDLESSDDSDDREVYGYDEDSRMAKKRKTDNTKNDDVDECVSDLDEDEDEDDEEDPVTKFRHGGDLPDLDLGDTNSLDVSDLENDTYDDNSEWNAMGAALEREFLGD
ncbi:hypothetical protein TKK_0002737 [Trichogramma kaykai]